MQCEFCFFFFQAEDGIRDADVTGVQTCALPIFSRVKPKKQEGVSAVKVNDFIREKVKETYGKAPFYFTHHTFNEDPFRSEERRVGKECRSRWSREHEKKKYNMLAGISASGS